jgi:hypothetical protein
MRNILFFRADPRGSRLLVCVVAMGLFLAGCRDATGPAGSIEVQLTASTREPFIGIMVDGPRITCDFEVTARATGPQGAHATWGEVVLRFAYGADRTAYTDSVVLHASEAREAWGATRIEVGETLHSSWSVWSGLPFTVQAEYRYRPGGSGPAQSASVQFHCGPQPAPGAAAPQIQQVVVSPPTGTLEVGSPSRLTVTYRVSAPAGVWESGVEVSGGITETVRRFGAEQTLEILVPPTAQLGEQVSVRAYVVDVAGRMVRSGPVVGPTLVDSTPPTLSFAGLAGQWAASDTLRLNVAAWDNHRLTHIVYQLGAPVNLRDSLHVANVPAMSYQIVIPLRPEWVGSPSMTVYARDASGLTSPARTSHPDSLHIYPERQRSLRSVEIAAEFGDVVHDAGRDQLYLSLPSANRVERVALGTMTSQALVALPGRPVGLDLSPDGRTLVVALATDRALAVVDLADPAAAPRIVPFSAAADGYSPRVVRFASSGRALVVASGPGRIRIVEFDPASGAQTTRWDEQMNLSDTAAGARSLDGSRIAFYLIDGCGVVVYEAATDRFGPCRVVATSGPLSASADGTRFAKGATVYDAQLQPIRTYAEIPLLTGISRDGTEFFLGAWKGLIRSSVNRHAHTERVPFPFFTTGRILHLRDGALPVVVGRQPVTGGWSTRVVAVELD